jgi:hypothetical protein
MRRLLLLALGAALTVPAPALARPGDLDKSFGDGGRVGFALGTYSSNPGGLTLAGGLHPLLGVGYSVNGTSVSDVLQLSATGRQTGSAPFAAPSYGAPMLSGDFALASTDRFHFALRPARGGSAVTLTVPYAAGTDYPVFDLVAFGVDGAGRAVLIGQRYVSVQAPPLAVAIRFLADGSVDPGYGTDGFADLGASFPLASGVVTADGHVYAVGGTYGRSPQLAALDPAGRPLAGFSRSALSHGRFAALSGATSIVPGPGATLLLVGSSGADRPRSWVARLDRQGRPDRRFGDRGLLDLNRAPYVRVALSTLVRDHHGRLVAGGFRTGAAGTEVRQGAILRFSARGVADRRFGTRGLVLKHPGIPKGVRIVASQVDALAIDARDRILVAGTVFDDDIVIRDDFGKSYVGVARLRG